MDPRSLSLQDLSGLSGVEARTIRSYIQRGLLPGPGSMGRNASYDEDHLHRLKAIALLRDARREITLEQIRQLFARLTAEQIRDMAEGTLSVGAVLDAAPPATTTVLEYLRSIERQAETERPSVAIRGGHEELERLLAVLGRVAGPPPSRRSVGQEVWHRVRVTPDVELSVRGPLRSDELAMLQRIADQLQHFLTRGIDR